VLVADDGQGFPTESDAITILDAAHVAVKGSRGLASMFQRAGRLGGNLTIESRRYRGSTVYVVIPLVEASDGGDGDTDRPA
jgi:signal transduction histidine kinase